MKNSEDRVKEVLSKWGKWFLSFRNTGEVKWHGEVLEELSPGVYLVQVTDPHGIRTPEQFVVRVDKMIGWRFYSSNEELLKAAKIYEQLYRQGVRT